MGAIADGLTALADATDGLTVLDMRHDHINLDAALPSGERDLTGSVWRGRKTWWLVNGFAGRERRTRKPYWMVRCVRCRYERLMRTYDLFTADAPCAGCNNPNPNAN